MMRKTNIKLIALAGTAWALLQPTAANAQTTPYTGTGWVNQVLAPGIFYPNALGQVLVRASLYTIRVESAEPSMAGRRTVLTGAAFQADGSAVVYGAAYQEVGTWAGTNFTPVGGMWEASWRGVMQTNYGLTASLVGYGSGGSIDGLRLEESLSRDPASNLYDPTVPIVYTGTIKPPPVSTTLAFDSFTNRSVGWALAYGCGNIRTYPTNGGQLYTRGDFTGCPPNQMANFFQAHPSSGNWSLADGQTLECQADLVGISEDTTNLARLVVGGDAGLYAFSLGSNTVALDKWTPAIHPNITLFWFDSTVHLPRTNVVLYLALTRDHRNAIITTRVLDKANQNAILFERSFLDTPQVDPSLTTAPYPTITLAPDPGAPILAANGWGGVSGGGGMGVLQFTDGTQPPVEATWDNFALRLHEVPPISLARAVRLTWPAPAGVNYSVEAAPTVQGPWLPIQDLEIPGIQKLTVPLSGPAQFFRLQQGP